MCFLVVYQYRQFKINWQWPHIPNSDHVIKIWEKQPLCNWKHKSTCLSYFLHWPHQAFTKFVQLLSAHCIAKIEMFELLDRDWKAQTMTSSRNKSSVRGSVKSFLRRIRTFISHIFSSSLNFRLSIRVLSRRYNIDDLLVCIPGRRWRRRRSKWAEVKLNAMIFLRTFLTHELLEEMNFSSSGKLQ